MSKNCNGGGVVDGIIPESTGGSVQTGAPDRDPEGKEFPPDRVFSGFIKIPFVYLDRYDISPYLNDSKKARPSNNRKQYSKKKKVFPSGEKSLPKRNGNVHQKRLSQKCVVRVFRDDLVKLKASYSKSLIPVHKELDSDSGDSSCSESEMVCKCKICSKSYNSEKKLLNHQRKKHIIYTNSKPMKRVSFSDHVIIHEVKEYHKCRKCPKIFKNYSSLKLHTKQQHKKRKSYICNYCDKNFAERMIFKVHIKLHCDVCRKLFPSRALCVDHKRTICRVLKLYKCKTCSESFYSFMGLKDHSYDHGPSCLVCDVCKEFFESKCMIAHHLSFLHANKRPQSMYTMRKMGNERLYLCNFCDESSVDRDIIEKHTDHLPDLNNRAMTGYSDHFFCDVCKKTFTTEQEMLQHKWTHFLKTTDKSQAPPNSTSKEIAEPTIKTIYNVNEPLPLQFQPTLVLQRLKLDEGSMKPLEFKEINIEMSVINPHDLKKAIVDPKSKKTLISRHQCETCEKYFSTNYCLNRHISTQHADYENLRCRVCEETFVWPSLLRTHKCIRLHHSEMPFDDARPEIHFDNLHDTGLDDFNITDNDDYMNAIDFEIPAPIVELTEGDTFLSFNPNQSMMNQVIQEKNCQLQSLGYKLVMQEVPIEF